MIGFRTVLGRELRERRLLLGMAFLLGLVPLALPYLPGVAPGAASDARLGTAIGLAIIGSALLSLLLGASVTAGDLFSGRMGFYFFRPLSGWAIWAGKLAAVFTLIAASTVLILAPALLANGGWDAVNVFAERSHGPDPVLSIVLWGVLVLFLTTLSHAAAVAIRSRSPWVVFDLAALAVAVTIAGSTWRKLRYEGLGLVDPANPGVGWTVLAWIAGGFGLAMFCALVAGGAVQVTAGRIDPRRGHRLQSLTLWGIAALALAGLLGAGRWALAVEPRDLRSAVALVEQRQGPWLWVLGSAPSRSGYYPSFFVDRRSGRFVRTRVVMSSLFSDPEPQFSADGRTVAWMEPAGPPSDLPMELKTLDLTDPRGRPRATGSTFSPSPGAEGFSFRLSPDGRLLAVLNGRRLTVENLEERKLLTAARVDAEDYLVKVLWFEGPARLRIDVLNQYRWGRHEADRGRTKVNLFALDLPNGELREVGRVEPVSVPGGYWWRDGDGDRAVLAGHDIQEVRDGSTGAFLATIEGRQVTSKFVPGGFLVVQQASPGRLVRLFDRDGKVEKGRLPLPESDRVAIRRGEDGSTAEVVAGGPHPIGRVEVWRRWRVDVGRGTFEPLPPLRLLGLQPGMVWDPKALRSAEGIAWSWYPTSPVRVFLHPPF